MAIGTLDPAFRRSLGGPSGGFAFQERSQRLIDGCGCRKFRGHVRLQEDEIRALREALHILAADALRKIVFPTHLPCARGSLPGFTGLLHMYSVPDGWRVGR